MALPSNWPGVPELIRGYGHVKSAAIEKAKAKQVKLLAAFANPEERARAAE